MLIYAAVASALLTAGCTSANRNQGDVELVRLSDAPQIAPPPRDFRPPHARYIPELDVTGVPATVRTFAPFQRVKVGMPLAEAIKLVGLPDGDFGGEGGRPRHLLIWDLEDGSWVSIRCDDLKTVEDIDRGYPINVNHPSR